MTLKEDWVNGESVDAAALNAIASKVNDLDTETAAATTAAAAALTTATGRAAAFAIALT